MSTPWRIELFGGLRASRGDQIITHFRTQKTAVLLAYLAYHSGQGPAPRDVLMELLWPEHDLSAARTSLSVALSSLRRQLEPKPGAGRWTPDAGKDVRPTPPPASSASRPAPDTIILSDHSSVRLNPAAVTTDVTEFQEALQKAGSVDGSGQAEWLARAVELFRGELLPGYHEQWILQERPWLTERYFEALDQLLGHLENAGDFRRALPHAQRGIGIDPLREEAHRHLMRIYAGAGQPAAGLRQYQELERLLAEQLGTAPDAVTLALARQIEDEAGVRAQGAVPNGRIGVGADPLIPPPPPPRGAFQRVALLYRRHTQPDEQLVKLIEARLTAHGHPVFVDRHLTVGVEWAREIERQVRSADAVIPLLSAPAADSEMLAYEIQTAHDAAQRQQGRPWLLPVRVNYTGPLPEPLAAILDRLEYTLWEGPHDDERLVEQLLTALQGSTTAHGSRLTAQGERTAQGSDQDTLNPEPCTVSRLTPCTVSREPPIAQRPGTTGGVVPLDSAYYVVRSTDAEFQAALQRRDSIVLVKGARQMGKTSLLARGLQQAREAGAQVVLTDFQMLELADLESVERLFRTLAGWIADQLDLEVVPDEVWKPHLGTSVNFERYLRREVLGRIEAPIVWALDEVDRLFPHESGSQVFGLFRSWHNRRGLEPTGPWSRLTLAIAYATEAHLFITDMNQSPFNVGTRLALEDFTLDQVADLNRRYGLPLRDQEPGDAGGEVSRYYRLVNGQPYLVNRGLQEMVARGLDLTAIERQADREEGIFGDHLRRLLVLLVNNPELCEVVRGVLRGQPCPSGAPFYRLRSAGVLAGDTASDVRIRCQLYETYLARHLL